MSEESLAKSDTPLRRFICACGFVTPGKMPKLFDLVTDGPLFCRRSNCISDLRHDEEERASVPDGFCYRGPADLLGPDLVLQDHPKPRKRGGGERVAASADADLNCVWCHSFLCG